MVYNVVISWKSDVAANTAGMLVPGCGKRAVIFMSKFMLIKQDQFAKVKYYQTANGSFTKDITKAAQFTQKEAEKRCQDAIRNMNRFMLGRVVVEVTEVEEVRDVGEKA